MKFRYFLRLIALAALALSSCTQEMIPETTDTVSSPQGELPASNFEQGIVRIFVEEGFNVESVKILPGAKIERTFPFSGKFEKRTHEAGLDRWYDIHFDQTKATLTKASLAVKDIPGIDIVEYVPIPQKTGTIVYQFDDPRLEEQWHYLGDECNINVEKVWSDYSVGSSDVIVAVIDEGVDYGHPDLAANMWENPEMPGTYGYNFCDDTYEIFPANHGTHVAGTIAAVNNNGIGVCGIAGGDSKAGIKGARIMSCQTFHGKASGDEVQAIKWAADHGAVIAQNSWTYTNIRFLPEATKMAIDYFNKNAGFDENGVQTGPMAGGIVIFAAGNSAQDYASPSCYENVMAVAAVDNNYKLASYSNYGDWVNISAPGGDYENEILSLFVDGEYGGMTGTSMACPHVSGVAALLISKFGGPGFTREMLWDRLINTTKDISAYNPGVLMGRGLVDCYAAMTANPSDTPPDPVTDLKVKNIKSNTVSFTLTLPKDAEGGSVAGIRMYYSTEPITSTKSHSGVTFPAGEIKAGEQMTIEVSNLEFSTNYYFVCESYDKSGLSSDISNMVTALTEENHPPVIETDDALEFTMHAHETKVLTFHLSDPDGHSFYFFTEAGHIAEINDPDGYFGETVRITIPGPQIEPGTYMGCLMVVDQYFETAEAFYTYTVLENHPPQLLRQPENIVLNSKTESNTLNLNDVFSDPDGETLSFRAVSSSSSIRATVNGNTLDISVLNLGYSTIELTATDACGKTATCNFQVLAREGSSKVDVFPTSVSNGMLTVRTPEDATVRIIIASSAGSVVYDETAATGPFNPKVIDISNLPAGVYSVRIETGTDTITRNIVKI